MKSLLTEEERCSLQGIALPVSIPWMAWACPVSHHPHTKALAPNSGRVGNPAETTGVALPYFHVT